MRSIQVTVITDAVKRLCMEANYVLPEDIYKAIKEGKDREESPVGKTILTDICANADLAREENMPIC